MICPTEHSRVLMHIVLPFFKKGRRQAVQWYDVNPTASWEAQKYLDNHCSMQDQQVHQVLLPGYCTACWASWQQDVTP